MNFRYIILPKVLRTCWTAILFWVLYIFNFFVKAKQNFLNGSVLNSHFLPSLCWVQCSFTATNSSCVHTLLHYRSTVCLILIKSLQRHWQALSTFYRENGNMERWNTEYPLILHSQNGVSVLRLPTMQPFLTASCAAQLHFVQPPQPNTLLFPCSLILFNTYLLTFPANEEQSYR